MWEINKWVIGTVIYIISAPDDSYNWIILRGHSPPCNILFYDTIHKNKSTNDAEAHIYDLLSVTEFVFLGTGLECVLCWHSIEF